MAHIVKCTLSGAISSLGRSHNGLRVSSISPVKYPVRGRPQYRIIGELDLPDLSEISSELSELQEFPEFWIMIL